MHMEASGGWVTALVVLLLTVGLIVGVVRASGWFGSRKASQPHVPEVTAGGSPPAAPLPRQTNALATTIAISSSIPWRWVILILTGLFVVFYAWPQLVNPWLEGNTPKQHRRPQSQALTQPATRYKPNTGDYRATASKRCGAVALVLELGTDVWSSWVPVPPGCNTETDPFHDSGVFVYECDFAGPAGKDCIRVRFRATREAFNLSETPRVTVTMVPNGY